MRSEFECRRVGFDSVDGIGRGNRRLHSGRFGGLVACLLTLFTPSVLSCQGRPGSTPPIPEPVRASEQACRAIDDPVLAARSGCVGRLRDLIPDRATANGDALGGHSTILIEAVGARQEEVVSYLLRVGADPNQSGRSRITALCKAALPQNERMLSLLLENGARCDSESACAPLARASQYQSYRSIEALVGAGCSLEAADEASGHRPLTAAASSGLIANVQCVLSHGADVNQRRTLGETSLFLSGDKSIRRALIEAGADLEAADAGGRTPSYSRRQRP